MVSVFHLLDFARAIVALSEFARARSALDDRKRGIAENVGESTELLCAERPADDGGVATITVRGT